MAHSGIVHYKKIAEIHLKGSLVARSIGEISVVSVKLDVAIVLMRMARKGQLNIEEHLIMKIWKLAFVTTAMIATTITVAEARKSTLSYTCHQAQNLVHSRGTILMSTGGHSYERFVSNRSFCPFGDYVKRAYAPTRDRRSCQVGYTCTMDNPFELLRD